MGTATSTHLWAGYFAKDISIRNVANIFKKVGHENDATGLAVISLFLTSVFFNRLTYISNKLLCLALILKLWLSRTYFHLNLKWLNHGVQLSIK